MSLVANDEEATHRRAADVRAICRRIEDLMSRRGVFCVTVVPTPGTNKVSRGVADLVRVCVGQDGEVYCYLRHTSASSDGRYHVRRTTVARGVAVGDIERFGPVERSAPISIPDPVVA